MKFMDDDLEDREGQPRSRQSLLEIDPAGFDHGLRGPVSGDEMRLT